MRDKRHGVVMTPHRVTDRRGSRRRTDDGAAIIEFALVLPILMLLIFGVISFGYMLSFRQAMSQGAAEAARAAAIVPASATEEMREAAAIGAVNDALGSYGVRCETGGGLTHAGGPAGTCRIEFKDSCTGGPAGSECVLVRLSYPYRSNSLIPGPGINAFMPADLVYSTEMRVS